MVFVEDDQIPLHYMKPGVLRLDVPHVVTPQQILEGTEIDERLASSDLRWIAG